jgi:predicted HAD superfamily phosphohydrolase YqeG
MIGDRLNTDILFGQAGDLATLLVSKVNDHYFGMNSVLQESHRSKISLAQTLRQ